MTTKKTAAPSHTPGPWKSATGWVMSKDNGVICGDFPGIYRDNGQAEANMNLIAAAPDLLAALKELLHEDNQGGGVDLDALDRARAAIAKAEGK